MCENNIKIGDVVIHTTNADRAKHLEGLGGVKHCSCKKSRKHSPQVVVVEDIVEETMMDVSVVEGADNYGSLSEE